MKVNFDFYVGHNYASDESGGWFIATVTHEVNVLSTLYVEDKHVAEAERQLRAELEEQGTTFVFIASAGYNSSDNDNQEEDDDE